MDFKKVTDHVITISYLGWREFSVTDHTLTLNGAFVSLFLLRSLLTLFLLFPSFVLLLKNACTFPAHCLMWAGYSVHDLCQVKEEKYSSFCNMNSWKKNLLTYFPLSISHSFLYAMLWSIQGHSCAEYRFCRWDLSLAQQNLYHKWVLNSSNIFSLY